MKSQKTILEHALGEYKVARQELLFYCPFCKHKNRKLSVNIEKNFWKCWVCESKGRNISYLINRFAPHLTDEWCFYDKSILTEDLEKTIENIFSGADKAKNIFEETPVFLPKEYRHFSENAKYPMEKLALNYLLNQRRLTWQDIYDYSIGYCTSGFYAGYIIIPSLNHNGQVNNFIARTFTNNLKKYDGPSVKKNNIIFNELFIDFNKPILITEGVFDAILSRKQSIPLLGSSLATNSKLYHRLAECPEITICLDKDAKTKQEKILENLSKINNNVHFIALKTDEDIAELSNFNEIFEVQREQYSKEPLYSLERRMRAIFE